MEAESKEGEGSIEGKEAEEKGKKCKVFGWVDPEVQGTGGRQKGETALF